MTLPEVIPLFPLPNVVLFPGLPLPLHIFEPRYRDMVRDAAAGARLVGMVLLRGDWQSRYEAKDAPIFPIGTAGEILRLDELPDGRFNVVLRGVREFTIIAEPERGTAYREGRVEWRPEPATRVPEAVRTALVDLIRRYVERLGHTDFVAPNLDDVKDDALLVNAMAHQLDVSPLEKQGLLEVADLTERARRLCDVLTFRLEELRAPAAPPSDRTH